MTKEIKYTRKLRSEYTEEEISLIGLQEYVAEKAIKEYLKVYASIKKMEDFLKDKKFPLGTFVIKKNEDYFDGVFGTGKGEIGVITGWDFDNNYYRVYFSDISPYVGTREKDLEVYEGDVPSNVKQHDSYKIKRIMVNL